MSTSKPWAKNFDRCITCGTKDRKHRAKGRCVACNDKWRYHNVPGFADKARARAKLWAFNHSEIVSARVREYLKKHPRKNSAYNKEYRRKRRAAVHVDIGGTTLKGTVKAWRWEDGERVADVQVPSGNVITFPTSCLVREVKW